MIRKIIRTMISHQTPFSFRLQDGWKVVHHSSYATLAVSNDGKYRFLLSKLLTESFQPLTDIHDGALTCYLENYLRTEQLEGNMTGHFVSGYLNLRPISGYALYLHTEKPGRFLLLATANGMSSLAELRRRTLTLAGQLGLAGAENDALKGY